MNVKVSAGWTGRLGPSVVAWLVLAGPSSRRCFASPSPFKALRRAGGGALQAQTLKAPLVGDTITWRQELRM